MNGLTKKVLVVLLLAITTAQVSAIAPRRVTQKKQQPPTTTVRETVQTVNKKEKPLKQILEQAEIIYTSPSGREGTKIRAKAKAEIDLLMNQINKIDKNKNIAANIQEEIAILKKTTDTKKSKDEAEKAYISLKKKIAAAKAEAKEAKVTAREAMRLRNLQNTPPNQIPQIIEESKQRVQNAKAEAERAGYLSRAYSAAKGFTTGSLFFGEESSALKTAWQALVGAAVIGGTAYYLGAHEMTAEEWKNLPFATKEAIAAKSGAVLESAKGWGSWGLEGAKELVGFGVKQAVAAQTTAAVVAGTGAVLSAAAKLLEDNPGNKNAMDNYNKAHEAHQAALEKQRLEKIEEDTKRLHQEEWGAEWMPKEPTAESAPAA